MFFNMGRRRVMALAIVLGANAALFSAERTVSVSGSGLVSVPADEVTINLSLSTVDDDLVRVRETSDKQVQAILDLAQKHGAKPGDYKVSSLKLALSYNEQLRRQVYEVEREMSVKLGVLANLNPLLADLLKLSEMQIASIEFGASKAREHEQEARRRAVTDAKETALHLAELAGLKLGKAQQISAFGEQQRPFVTSVIPFVGRADPFGSRRERRAAQEQPDAPAAAAISIPRNIADNLFVAAQVAGAEGKAPADGTFGLGLIDFTASISIDFELID